MGRKASSMIDEFCRCRLRYIFMQRFFGESDLRFENEMEVRRDSRIVDGGMEYSGWVICFHRLLSKNRSNTRRPRLLADEYNMRGQLRIILFER